MVSKELDDLPPGWRERGDVLGCRDEVQVSQNPSIQFQCRKGHSTREGEGCKLWCNGLLARTGEVFEDEALIVVERFR